MRPRWQTAFIVLTTPVWIIPALLYIGWVEAGLDYCKEIPKAMKYIIKGERP